MKDEPLDAEAPPRPTVEIVLWVGIVAVAVAAIAGIAAACVRAPDRSTTAASAILVVAGMALTPMIVAAFASFWIRNQR